MNKTAIIMSREEAMALPLKDRPLCYRINSATYTAIFEAIGQASMCWNPRPSDETFNPEEAEKIAVNLCFKVAEENESLKEQVERLTRENTCDVCGGTGKPASNKPCMCQGTGKATDADAPHGCRHSKNRWQAVLYRMAAYGRTSRAA